MKSYKNIIFINLLLIIFVLSAIILRTELINTNMDDNIHTIDMKNNRNLILKNGSNIRLNILFSNNFQISSNKLYKWSSSDNKVCNVTSDGIVSAKSPGSTSIKATMGRNIIKTKVTVYDVKKILVIVGDSRMDNFKDDNNFMSTSKYEVKYLDKTSLLSNFDRIYVVSLGGMRYNWLAGEDGYQSNNAAKYVEEIIHEYEEKTTDIYKYDIKILFNLGVNDLNHKYLKNDNPTDIAKKYLNKLEDIMNNVWKSDIINNISLNIITLFPVNDEQVACYFPERYNKDVIEFNNYIKKEYDGVVCDAYSDLDFNQNSFRERNNKECATRDGLHFSEEFNKKILYPYLVNICGKK